MAELLNKEEASKKICPLMSKPPTYVYCHTDSCMFWCWIDSDATKRSKKARGYCIAGK